MRVNEPETKEAENTIKQDAEYWQTSNKMMKIMKTKATNTRFWERKSNGSNEWMNESRENLQLSHIYTENIIKISI